MNTGLRSLVEPKKLQFLKKKLELGEISQKECKEIIKRLILQKYDRIENRSFRASILGFGRSLESKPTTKVISSPSPFNSLLIEFLILSALYFTFLSCLGFAVLTIQGIIPL